MYESVTVLVPPADEPISLAEAKLHCRVDIPDDDALLISLVTAARLVCETRLRQKLVTQALVYRAGSSWGGGRPSLPPGAVLPTWLALSPGGSPFPSSLPWPPLQTVVSIRYYDFGGVLQTVDPSRYVFQPGTPAWIAPVFGSVWPLPQPRDGSVEVTYVVGYGDPPSVPENVKAAIKLLVGHWYWNREAVSDGPASALPEAVDALLAASDHGVYA